MKKFSCKVLYENLSVKEPFAAVGRLYAGIAIHGYSVQDNGK